MSDIQSNASVKMSGVDASGSTISTRSEGATWRRGVALAGIAALLIETVAALMQAPRVEPLRTAMPMSLEWWRYPVERNAIQRMPVTGGPLSAVYALRGTDEVWFAGAGGLIVHSRDGGRSWDSTNVSAAMQRQAVPAPAPNAARQTAPAQRAPTRAKKARARMRNAPTPRASLVALRQDAQGYGSPQSQQSPTQQSPAQQSYSKDPKQSAANAVQRRPVQPLVTVPNVVGMRAGPAEKLLLSQSLRFTETYATVYDSAQTDVVSSQSPRAGAPVSRGTSVALSIGRYAAPEQKVPATTDSQPSIASRPIDTTSQRFFPRLTGVCVAAPGGLGWAVGERGAAFRTTDGGDSWRQVPTGIVRDFDALACNPTVGAMAATSGGDMVWLRTDGTASVDTLSNAWSSVGTLMIGAGDTIWSTGTGRGLRYSADRGRTWAVVDSARRTVAVADANTRLAVDSAGTISRSSDGGRSWTAAGRCPRDGAPAPGTSTIVPASANVALMVDKLGRVARIADGGAACAPVFQLDGRGHQLAPASESVWYAASDDAFRSDDGGRSWHALISTTRFASLAFRDSLHGVAGLENGLVGTTSDGGRRWTLNRVDFGRTSAPIHFAQRTASEIFAADDRGRVFRSTDGASTWEQRPATDSVVPLVFTDAQTGWGVSPNGATWTTQDGGTTWSTAALPGSLGGLARAMSDSAGRFALRRFGVSHTGGNVAQVWVTTPANQLVAISSAGWDTLATGIRDASPVAGAAAFGLDTLGTLMRSTDGRAWTAVDLAPPRKYPAPWYYALAVLTVAGTLATARARRPSDAPAEESIADILVSDRPLREGDRDVLDFGKIAAGLSRFIRNTRTEPPLTIAVTGPWGTGKSSLMNLLRRDLQRRGFRTIWFNAWHHQREESLLASLLEAIRLTATPPLWSPIGIRFRLRLLAKRFHRYRAALVLLPVFALAVGYILKDPARRWNDLGAGVQAIMGAFKSEPTAASKPSATTVTRSPGDTSATTAVAGTTTSAQSGTTGGTPRKTVVALIISIVGTILTYFKGLKAFGVKPGEVAKSVMSAGRVRTIESQPAFRYRFAQDFSEVTQALKPERLVIFVDDLDRCKPEQVLEILEAINFLAESGDCVVVLGIDRERVTGCVAIGFKDVATVLAEARTKPAPTRPLESVPQPDIGRAVVPKPYILAEAAPAAPPPPAKTNLDYQIEYARHYLEKLLNMEIPIPPATPAGLGNVMTSSGAASDPEEAESPETTEEIRDRLRRRRRGQIYAGAIAAATVAAFVWGLRGDFARRAPVSTPREIGVLQAGTTAPDTTAQPAVASTPITPTVTESETLRRDPMPFVAGTAASTAWWVHVPLALVAIATLLWLLTPREDNRVEDSQAFATALRAWAPVLFEEHPTPRSAKKFLNKMRFLSMAQRAPTERRAPVETLIERLSAVPWIGPIFGRTPDEEPPDALLRDAIPEVTLVSLNVIRDRYPEWLDDPSFWTSDLHEYVEGRIKPVPPEIAEALRGLGDIETRLYMGRHKEAWQRLELWVRDA